MMTIAACVRSVVWALLARCITCLTMKNEILGELLGFAGALRIRFL